MNDAMRGCLQTQALIAHAHEFISRQFPYTHDLAEALQLVDDLLDLRESTYQPAQRTKDRPHMADMRRIPARRANDLVLPYGIKLMDVTSYHDPEPMVWLWVDRDRHPCSTLTVEGCETYTRLRQRADDIMAGLGATDDPPGGE